MNESQRERKRSELADWLEGPFVKEYLRYLDAQIKHVESTPLLAQDPENIEYAHARGLGELEGLTEARYALDPERNSHEQCFYPQEDGQ